MSDADAALARRLIGLLDLTNLETNCGPAEIKALCARARLAPAGAGRGGVPLAAIRRRGRARAERTAACTVATVINFPDGGEDLERVLDDTERGAGRRRRRDRPRPALQGRSCAATTAAGLRHGPRRRRASCRRGQAAEGDPGDRRLCPIIDTVGRGVASSPSRRGPTSSRPRPARSPSRRRRRPRGRCWSVIRDAARPVGFKAAGGIRTLADAALYLGLAEDDHGRRAGRRPPRSASAPAACTTRCVGGRRTAAAAPDARAGLLTHAAAGDHPHASATAASSATPRSRFSSTGLTDGTRDRGAGRRLRHGGVLPRHDDAPSAWR